jgi:hypothetical protein
MSSYRIATCLAVVGGFLGLVSFFSALQTAFRSWWMSAVKVMAGYRWLRIATVITLFSNLAGTGSMIGGSMKIRL